MSRLEETLYVLVLLFGSALIIYFCVTFERRTRESIETCGDAVSYCSRWQGSSACKDLVNQYCK